MDRPERRKDPAALAIYQDHVDLLSRALIAGDFATFSARFAFPHVTQTRTDRFVIENAEQHARLFDSHVSGLRISGVTDLVRFADAAWFDSEDVILGAHTSHVMRDGVRLMGPYPNRLRLQRGPDNIWRETHSANGIENTAGVFSLVSAREPDLDAPDLAITSERKPE